jgi:hypothetical protein
MMSLKSGFPLQEDERLVLEIESKLYMTSPYLFWRIIWGMIRPTLQILGFFRKGYLIATSKRFVEYYVQTIFWFIKIRRYAESVPLKKIDGNIHSVKKGRFLFFCRTYHISYDKYCFWKFPWLRVYAVLRGKDEEEANKIVSLLGQAVIAAN